MTQVKTIHSILSSEPVKKRFNEILGQRANVFMSSIISATKANKKLLECNPDSVISSAVIAATLNLPIENNLGRAYIIPYNSRSGLVAQFQMGWKGFVELALRTKEYKTINASEVYEGELVKNDRLTGEILLDATKRKSDRVIGYVAYFKLLSGFEKSMYWTYEQMVTHGKKYSKSYSNADSRWQLDFLSMALKTVIKMLLSKYGTLSVEMHTAILTDQAFIKNPDTLDVVYIDSKAKKDGATALENKPQEKITVTVKE